MILSFTEIYLMKWNIRSLIKTLLNQYLTKKSLMVALWILGLFYWAFDEHSSNNLNLNYKLQLTFNWTCLHSYKLGKTTCFIEDCDHTLRCKLWWDMMSDSPVGGITGGNIISGGPNPVFLFTAKNPPPFFLLCDFPAASPTLAANSNIPVSPSWWRALVSR